MTLEKIAWAAGLFDGEGCISISYVPPSKRSDFVNCCYRLTVKLTMGHRETVEEFGRIVRYGSFHKHKARGKRINASYSWVAMSRKAEEVLKLLFPYLLTKLAEADIALDFMRLPDGRTGGKGGSRPVSRKLMQQRHDLYLKCAQLKPRWRFRKNKPGPHPEQPRVSR